MTRRMIIALLLIVLFAAAPLLVAFAAGLTAAALGCALDEGSVHPCFVFGRDIGEVLYFFGVFAWFTMATIPLAAIALVAWCVVALIAIVIHLRRRNV